MPATVLVVDDDEPTQKLIEALLRRNGLDTIAAINGAAAIAVIDQRDDIGCIILDLMMPEVGGPAVLDHLRTMQRDIPVIVCTAMVARTLPPLDRSVVRAVLHKPFDIEHLTETVLRLTGV